MKSLAKVILLLLLAISLTACGAPEKTEPTYDHQYLAGGYYAGSLEFEEVSHKDTDPAIHLREIYIDPVTLAHGYVVIDVQSAQELTFTLRVDAQHKDGTVINGASTEVNLVPGEPWYTELDFGGWADGAYFLTLSTEGLATNQTIQFQMG